MENAEFIAAYVDVLTEAISITRSRSHTRDAVVSLEGKFIHGMEDITFMIHTKLARIRGLVEGPQPPARRERIARAEAAAEELRDLINYAAFGVVLLSCKLDAED